MFPFLNIESLLSSMDEHRKYQERKDNFKKYELHLEGDKYLGSYKFNIPFNYVNVDFTKNLIIFKCENGTVDVYDTSPKFITNCLSVEDLGMSVILCKKKEGDYTGQLINYATGKKSKCKSYRVGGMMSKFNSQGNIVLHKSFSESCVVNLKLEEVFLNTNLLDYIYLDNNIISIGDKLYSALTGEFLTKKAQTSIKSKNSIFINPDYGSNEPVIEINKITCEMIKHE